MTMHASLSRRSLVKLAAVAALALPANVALAGCSPSNGDAPASQPAGSTKAPAGASKSAASNDAPAAAAPSQGSPVLVAYFSATGHTQKVAEVVADQLGADVFVITPKQPYTSEELNYNDESSRVCREHDDPDRSVELEVVTPEGFDGYETVFVGYPTWWQHASWVLDDFVTGNDFTDKRVVPFTTSASSPLGESASDLAALAGTGDWDEGVRFAASVGEDEVRAWVDGLEL